jgi:hypothetical protein
MNYKLGVTVISSNKMDGTIRPSINSALTKYFLLIFPVISTTGSSIIGKDAPSISTAFTTRILGWTWDSDSFMVNLSESREASRAELANNPQLITSVRIHLKCDVKFMVLGFKALD